jgi:hypothetical protein
LPLSFRSWSSLKVLQRLGKYFSFHLKVYCIFGGSGILYIDFEVGFHNTFPAAVNLKMGSTAFSESFEKL